MELSEQIQSASHTSNGRGMSEGIKKALGLTQSKTASLKSTNGKVSSSKQADGQIGGALLRALLQNEHSLCLSLGSNRGHARHVRAGQGAHSRGAEQDHR